MQITSLVTHCCGTGFHSTTCPKSADVVVWVTLSCINRVATGCKILSWHLSALRFPWIILSFIVPVKIMPPHTITQPPPKAARHRQRTWQVLAVTHVLNTGLRHKSIFLSTLAPYKGKINRVSLHYCPYLLSFVVFSSRGKPNSTQPLPSNQWTEYPELFCLVFFFCILYQGRGTWCVAQTLNKS